MPLEEPEASHPPKPRPKPSEDPTDPTPSPPTPGVAAPPPAADGELQGRALIQVSPDSREGLPPEEAPFSAPVPPEVLDVPSASVTALPGPTTKTVAQTAPKRSLAQEFAAKWSQSAQPAANAPIDKVGQTLRRQEQILQRDPDNVRIWYARGLLLSDLDRISEALLCFDRVTALEPNFRGVWTARSYLLRRLGREDEAAESMRRGLLSVAKSLSPEQHKNIVGTEAVSRQLEVWRTEGFDVRPLERILESDPAKAVRLSLTFAQNVEKIRQMRPSVERLAAAGRDVEWALEAMGRPFDFSSYEADTRDLVRTSEALEAPAPPTEPVAVPGSPLALGSSPLGTPGPSPTAIAVPPAVPSTPGRGSEAIGSSRSSPSIAPSPSLPVPPVSPPIPSVPPPRSQNASVLTLEPIGPFRETSVSPPPRPIPRSTGGPSRPRGQTNGQRGRTNGARAEAKGLRGRTNGLTNGRRGQTNGLGETNGLTNGRRGQTNGLGKTNGLTNGRRGQTNGLGKTNGFRNGRRGQTNGLGKTNGLTNGRRGQTNGLTNGSRRTAGVTNGLVNGLQSARSGMTNGITNGLGMTNGLGALRHAQESRAAKWKVYLVPLFSLALLLAPLLSGGESVTVRHVITVDGSLMEWSGLTATRASLPPSTAVSPNVDVTEAGFVAGLDYWGGYLRVRGTALSGDGLFTEDALRVLIDSDGDASTGYDLEEGFGADHLIELRGMNQTVDSAVLATYDGSGGRADWNGWSASGTVPAALLGGIIEYEVPRMWIDPGPAPRMTVRTQGWDGRTDRSPNLALGPRLTVTQESLAPVTVLPGTRDAFMRITVEAFEDPVQLDRLILTVEGTTDPADLVVPPTLSGIPGIVIPGGRVLFDTATSVNPGAPITYIVTAGTGTGAIGRTLGFSVRTPSEVLANDAAVTLETIVSDRGLAHIQAVPPGPRVDGGFGDWVAENTTRANAAVKGNADIDLVSTAFQVQGTEVYAFAEVAGRLFAGQSVPLEPVQRPSTPNLPDEDRDTVPDFSDLLPYDFDNDGIGDGATLGDVDRDGLADYPGGMDTLLETTIPITFPLPYAGKVVRVYIGLVTPPPRTGEDTLRVYVDADAVPSQGYSRGGLYADYLLQLTGKNGRVRDAGLYRFPATASPGDGNAWVRMGTVRHFLDRSRVEVAADLGIALNATLASAYIEIEDVKGGTDTARTLWPPGSPNYLIHSPPERPRGTRGSTAIDPGSPSTSTEYNHQRKSVRAGNVAGDTACDSTNSDGCWYDVFHDVLVEPALSTIAPTTETITTGCKLGYGQPVSDLDSGTFTPTPLWSRLDDNSDSDYVSTANAIDYDIVALNGMCDPQSSTNHVFRWRARSMSGGGAAEKSEVMLFESSTQIATSGAVNLARGTFTTYTYTLTAAEADSITNYADLRIRFKADTLGSGETMDLAWVEFETSTTAGRFPSGISSDDVTSLTYGERMSPEAVAIYHSTTGDTGDQAPKMRKWDGTRWSLETELQSSFDTNRALRFARSRTDAFTWGFPLAQTDTFVDSYSCDSTSCGRGDDWGQLDSSPPASGPYSHFDFAYESVSGDALQVYSVETTDTTKDIAYRVRQGGSWYSEAYLDDTSESGDHVYESLMLASDPNSDKIALIARDQTNQDVNAWIWSGSSWGSFVEITASSETTSLERDSIGWETNSGNVLAIAAETSATDQHFKWVEYTTSWSSPATYQVSASATSTIQFTALVPNPLSSANDMVLAISTSDSHLKTMYWSGSAWSNLVDHDSAIDTVTLARDFDFAWEPTGSKGLLVWGTTAGQIAYKTFTAASTWGSQTNPAMGSNAHMAVALTTNFLASGSEVKILGAVHELTAIDLGGIQWDGTTFTVIGASTFTANAATDSYARFDLEGQRVRKDDLLVQYAWSGIGEADSYDLVIKGYRGDEDINVEVYNGASWTSRLTISATANTLHSYHLTSSEYNGGSPQIRFVDSSGTTGVRSDLYLDWVVIEATSSLTTATTETITTGTKISGTFATDIQTRNAAYIRYQEASDALSVKYDWTGVTAGTSNTLYIKGYRTDENINVQVLTPPSTWNSRITITATSNTQYTYTLTGTEFNSGAPSVRFVDAGGASGNSDVYLDFAAVSTNADYDRVIVMRSTAVDASTWGAPVILASGRAGHGPLLMARDSTQPSIAIDSAGYLHVVWASGNLGGDYSPMNQVRYTKTTVAYPTQAELASVSNWESSTNVDGTNLGILPTVSTDSGNYPHVAWSASTSAGEIDYRSKYGGSWRSTIFWTSTYTGLSVDVSPQNNYVSLTRFSDLATDEIQYTVCKDLSTSNCDLSSEFTKWDGTSGYDVVDTNIVGLSSYSSTRTYPSLATTQDANGDLWVVYSKNYAVDDAGVYARYLDYPSSGWQTAELVDTLTGADTMMYPSVGLDNTGKVYVMYTDVAGGPDLYYCVRSGGTWGTRTMIGNADNPALVVRMPADATYGADMGGVYYKVTTTETYHWMTDSVPEFTDLALPVVGMVLLPLLARRRARRKTVSSETLADRAGELIRGGGQRGAREADTLRVEGESP